MFDRPARTGESDRAIRRWTVRQALARAVEVARWKGLKVLWFKILGETVYRRVLFVEGILNRPPPPLEFMPSIEISELRENEIDDYRSLRSDETAYEIGRRLRSGHRCWVTRYDGRIATAWWGVTGRAFIDPLGCEILLASDEIYTYGSFTDPRYRGQHLPAARYWLLRPMLEAEGFCRFLGIVEPDDPAAVRHSQRSGLSTIGTVGYFRIGPWRRYFVRPTSGGSRIPSLLTRHDWNESAARVAAGDYMLDPFLAEQKRRAYLGLLERWAGPMAGGRVLKTDLFEEAFGSDAFLWDIGDNETQRIGIDVAAITASAAHRRDGKEQMRCVVADARHLPFKNNSFSVVVSPSTLDHFPAPEGLQQSLREIARVLMSTGTLVITLDNRDNVSDWLLRLAAKMGWVPFFLGRSFSQAELCAELEEAGFAVADTAAILHTPRLFAAGSMRIARALHVQWIERKLESLLVHLQAFEHTRWRYRTASFVAAKAILPRESPGA